MKRKQKKNSSSSAIMDEIKNRWSPRAFAEDPLDDDIIRTLFEAARSAPSSFNEQPWRFVIAQKSDAHYEKLFSGLNEGNKEWAWTAPLLGAAICKKTFSRNDRINAHCRHDVGLAMATLTIQATHMDIYVHQMAGILPDVIAENFNIDQQLYDVVSMFVIGYPDHNRLAELPEKYRNSGKGDSPRKKLDEFLFAEEFGKNPDWLNS